MNMICFPSLNGIFDKEILILKVGGVGSMKRRDGMNCI